jgi:hypothetical protein
LTALHLKKLSVNVSSSASKSSGNLTFYYLAFQNTPSANPFKYYAYPKLR